MPPYLKKVPTRKRYSLDERTFDRATRDGRLPPPSMYIGRSPVWDVEVLDAHDREAIIRAKIKHEQEAAAANAAV